MTGSRSPKRLARRAAALMLPLLLVALAGCTGDPQDTLTHNGDVSSRITDLFFLTFWIAVVVFFLVEIGLVVIVIRYRRRRNQEGLPAQIHGNTPLEITWTIVPVIILGVLAIPTVQGIRYLADIP